MSCERNPARRLESPKTRKPDESVLTREQIAALAGQLFGRDRVIFRLFITCGLRPGEVFCLRRGDWSRDRCALRIDETTYEGEVKEPKSESSDANVFVPPATASELQAWLDTTEGGPDDWMFRSRTKRPFRHASYLKHTLRPAAKRAGIAKIDFRMLRRSCATEAQRYATVTDTAEQMRHADPAVTLRFYQKPILESVREAFTAMEKDLFAESEKADKGGIVQ